MPHVINESEGGALKLEVHIVVCATDEFGLKLVWPQAGHLQSRSNNIVCDISLHEVMCHSRPSDTSCAMCVQGKRSDHIEACAATTQQGQHVHCVFTV